MIRSKLLLCADRVIRDADGGTLSIINILDDIIAESFPVLIQRFAIVNFLTKEAEDSDKPNISLAIYNNDDILANHGIKIDFRGKSVTRAIIHLGGIPFNQPGEGRFVILNEGAEIDRYTINLSLRPEVTVQVG